MLNRRAAQRSRIGLVLALAMLSQASAAVAAGKPGYPDRVTWSGVSWQVKTSQSAVGPGPNLFSKDNVWVDAAGLHLRVAQLNGKWTSAEVIGPTSYGYGTYTFVIGSDVSQLDSNLVLGFFTWSDKAPYAHREIDIEVARWGSATDPTNAQFVVQPYDATGHLVRFSQPSASRTRLQFRWTATGIAFEARRLDSNTLIAAYTYSGTGIPHPGDERVRLNLWLFGGAAPLNGLAQSVVVESFAFTP